MVKIEYHDCHWHLQMYDCTVVCSLMCDPVTIDNGLSSHDGHNTMGCDSLRQLLWQSYQLIKAFVTETCSHFMKKKKNMF